MTNTSKYNLILETAGNALRVTSWPHKRQNIVLSNGIELSGSDVLTFARRCKSKALCTHMDAIYAESNASEDVRTKIAEEFSRAFVSEQQRQKYSSKSSEERNVIREHLLEIRTKRKSKGFDKGVTPWNKGQTKHTNEALRGISSKRTGAGNPMYGKQHTEELKKRRSEEVRQRIADGSWTPHAHNSRTHWQCRIGDKQYRSSWEVLFQLLHPSAVYEQVRVPYMHNGNRKTYIVDFVCQETRTLYEIKPAERINDPLNEDKFKAAQQWAELNAFTFVIVTQQYFIDNFHKLPPDLSEYIQNATTKLRPIQNEASKKD